MALWGWDWSAIGAWILQFLGIVLAPVFGVLGAFVGARLSTREARRRWKADRDDTRRNAARSEVLEVAASCYEWASAQFTYGMTQLGIRGPATPSDRELSDALNAALLRQRIAFAALYSGTAGEGIRATAQTLEAAAIPYREFISHDPAGVLNGDSKAREVAIGRLVKGSADYRTELDRWFSSIAPLLVPPVDA
jgi:hypothetical protein